MSTSRLHSSGFTAAMTAAAMPMRRLRSPVVASRPAPNRHPARPSSPTPIDPMSDTATRHPVTVVTPTDCSPASSSV